MDQFFVEPKGRGYEVIKTSVDGRVWRVGVFSNKENAIFWIKDQMDSARQSWAMPTSDHNRR